MGPKSPKRTSLSPLPPVPAPQNNHSNLFLSSALLGLPEPHHPNGVIQSTTQDAPLALITKPRKDSATRGKSPQCDSDSGSMPVNLSTGASRTQPPTTSPNATGHGSKKNKSLLGKGLGLGLGQAQADALAAWKGLPQNHLVQSLVDLFRGGESGIGIPGVSIPGVGIPGVGLPGTCNPTAGLPANKESDDSGDDDDDEDDDLEEEDEEDSDDSLSESDSNSDSDISGKKSKELKLQPGLSKKESSSRRLTKGAELLNTSTNHTATSSSPLNLQVIKSPSSSALAYHSSPGSSYSLASPLGLVKKKRVMDEKELMLPLELGWRRETRIKSVAGRPQGDVAYYGPCGKKLRQYPDVMKYLSRNGISGITRDNFSFSAKIRVGDFYEAREGPQVTAFHLSLPDPCSSFHLEAGKAHAAVTVRQARAKASVALVLRPLSVHGNMS